MNEASHEDVIKILQKLDEIEKDISEIKLAQQDTAGKMKGNQEITELKLAHMEETTRLRDDKQAAEFALIKEQVNVNKSGVKDTYDIIRDTVEHINTKNNTTTTEVERLKIHVKILTGSIIAIGPLLIYGIVQMILIWGKVKGF